VADEAEAVQVAPSEGDREGPLPLGAMRGGPEVGDLVHRVLEATDFAADDLRAELAARLGEQRRRRDVELGSDEATVVAGLRTALQTPLGSLVGGLRLSAVGRGDRLDELVFELPLVGGERPSGRLLVRDIAALLEAFVPAGDPLQGYAERLRDPALWRELRGFLTGVIDLVLRVPDASGRVRYSVVDYKTNWLGAEGEELSARHYRPEALAEAMQRSHYPLQALLYLVALHRYLRWRLAPYDPARDLGGVLYLFVRGMLGEDDSTGVFAWEPPAGLVEALSDLLDRGAA
jgi:exodeoxyribonuclease V beta subunit